MDVDFSHILKLGLLSNDCFFVLRSESESDESTVNSQIYSRTTNNFFLFL
jgi:hypothetical protein